MGECRGVYFLIEEMHIKRGELYLRHVRAHAKGLSKRGMGAPGATVGWFGAKSPIFPLMQDPATRKEFKTLLPANVEEYLFRKKETKNETKQVMTSRG